MPRELDALTLWRAELAAGKRTRDTFDALWRAACREAAARDLEREARAIERTAPLVAAAYHRTAAEYRYEAAEVIVSAARAKRRAA